MPRLILTEGAILGLERCRVFLANKAPTAAARAGHTIAARLRSLEVTPEIGRHFDLEDGLRELLIAFGESGYVALYRYEPTEDSVYVLAFRHQKEAGYG